VGALFAILQLTRRVLGVLAGWLGDKYGAAQILSAGLGLESVAYVWFTFAGRSFLAWAAAFALLGFGGAMNNNGSRTLITAGRSAASAVNLSRYYVSINLAGLIGPLIGSALLTAGLARIGFLAAAGLHVLFGGASVILLSGMAAPDARSVKLSNMADGLRDRALLYYCGLAVGGWFLISQYRIALPLAIVHQKLSGGWLGPLTALNAIICMIAVSLIGKWIAKRGTIARLDVLTISGVVLGGGWLLCSFGGLGPLAAAVIVTSLGESLFCSVLDAVVVTMAPRGATGLYLGYSALAWGIGGMLAGFTGGLFDLAVRHGVVIGFWGGLAAVGVAAAAGTRRGYRYFNAVIVERQAAAAPESSAVSG
ncbi:MAG: MFS transporter, partial [Nocardiopsaceae bacterium]|nr:MFS transporter [Nocardiopsaceae bacterium]